MVLLLASDRYMCLFVIEAITNDVSDVYGLQFESTTLYVQLCLWKYAML